MIKKILAASLALAASIYATERVYMAPFNMIGLNENFALPAEKLLNTYIEDNKNFILLNYTEQDSVKAGDRVAANKKAIEKNCSKFIIAEFTRLGENVMSGATALRLRIRTILTRLSSASPVTSVQTRRQPMTTIFTP